MSYTGRQYLLSRSVDSSSAPNHLADFGSSPERSLLFVKEDCFNLSTCQKGSRHAGENPLSSPHLQRAMHILSICSHLASSRSRSAGCERATRPLAWRAAWRPGWRVWRPPRGCTWRAAPRRFAVRVRGSPSRTGASPRLRGGPRRRRARRMMARCGGTVDAFARDRCARTRDKSRRWRVSRTSGRGWRTREARVSVASTRCGARVP